MRTIAFIVLNYNDAKTTTGLVDELNKFCGTSFNHKIVVVDNDSPDGSLAVLCERYDHESGIDIIASDRNGGYSYGNNFGARYAIKKYHPDYIAIANPDIWVDERTVGELLDTFKEDDSICMCAPVMKDLKGNYKTAPLRLPEFKDDLKACFSEKKSKVRIAENFEYVNGKENMVFTDFLPGSFFIIRADVFENVGMLDEGVFLFCEERILGFRIKAQGYKAVLRTDLYFVHAHSVSINKAYKVLQTRKMILDSRLYYEINYNQISKWQILIYKLASSLSIYYLLARITIYNILFKKR